MAVLPEIFQNGQYLLMNISFQLAHDSRPAKMLGQIVWSSDLDQGQIGYRSGVRLIDLSTIELDQLWNLIKSS